MNENIIVARPPGNGNNCNGHLRSIQAGGNGHWVGDSCGCEFDGPASPIDSGIGILITMAIGIFIIVKKIK